MEHRREAETELRKLAMRTSRSTVRRVLVDERVLPDPDRRAPVHRDVVVEFTKELSEFNDDITRCSWFVELSRVRGGALRGPARDDAITSILSNPKTIEQALELAIKHGKEGTYWDDAFWAIGA